MEWISERKYDDCSCYTEKFVKLCCLYHTVLAINSNGLKKLC